MSFEALMKQLQSLNSSVETLAAIGAELRLRSERLSGDPHVRTLLQEVVHKIDPSLLEGLNPGQDHVALALIQTSFRQAIDLFENPTRPAGWSYEDPVILESQGRVSRLIIRNIEMVAAQRPDINSALLRPGAFLDIGTGVGWLAIEAARTWPTLQVVGIDSWEPALNLARKNLAENDLDGRVELRLQKIEELHDNAIFSLAWLPGPFIAPETIGPAVERVYQALAPGGRLVVGLYPPPPDALGQALVNLRIVRSGGHPWTPNQIQEQLQPLGFERIETFSPTPAVSLILAQRPA
jgi:SAM-dependent methyltransferase